jgi:hypothetical protein
MTQPTQKKMLWYTLYDTVEVENRLYLHAQGGSLLAIINNIICVSIYILHIFAIPVYHSIERQPVVRLTGDKSGNFLS